MKLHLKVSKTIWLSIVLYLAFIAITGSLLFSYVDVMAINRKAIILSAPLFAFIAYQWVSDKKIV